MKFTKLDQQWVLSFLLIDALFWVVVLWSCILARTSCSEIASFAPAFFYSPFYFFAPNLGSINGMGVELIVGPLVGTLFHGAIGFGVGRWFKKHKFTWPAGLFIAASFIFLIAIVTTQIALAMGWAN